jgi:hypothetical protein
MTARCCKSAEGSQITNIHFVRPDYSYPSNSKTGVGIVLGCLYAVALRGMRNNMATTAIVPGDIKGSTQKRFYYNLRR